MAVKKATSAAKKGVPPKKAAPRKASPGKAPAAKAVANKTAKAAKTAKTAKSAKTPNKVLAMKATKTAKSAKTTKTPTTPTVGSKRGGAARTATGTSVQPQRLRVLENERPWTVKELEAVRAELEDDVARLQKEISLAELDLVGLMRDAGDGAGDDQADAGTATFEREQEISLANNAREVFEQSARALARLVDDSYGICESCGNPIGKNRLLAFPRATLCLTCKAKQERR